MGRTSVPFETFTGGLVKDALLQLEFGNLEDIFFCEAFLVAGNQTTLRVTQTHHSGTEFDDLESGELCDVSGSRDKDLGLGVGEGDTIGGVVGVQMRDHFQAVIDQSITGGLWTSVGTSPRRALAGEYTDPLVTELLVSTEEEANFASAGSLYPSDW